MAITVSVSGLNAVYKGISTLKLHDVTNDILYNWSTPLSASLETNIETRDITSRDKTGKMSRVNVVETGAMPMLNLSYSSWKAPKFIAATGYQEELGTFSMSYVNDFRVPVGGVISAVTSGFYGYEIVEDAVAYASYDDNGSSIQITQVNYATFNAATDDTFAVGDNGEFKFSTNLVGAYVSVKVDVTVDGVGYGSGLTGEFEIDYTVVDYQNKITYVKIYNAVIDVTGKSYNPESETIDINFKLLTGGSECLAYKIVDSEGRVKCG
jgi:hypothetical protein